VENEVQLQPTDQTPCCTLKAKAVMDTFFKRVTQLYRFTYTAECAKFQIVNVLQHQNIVMSGDKEMDE